VDLGDHVAALGHAGLVDGDRAVDAVLGRHLLASLKLSTRNCSYLFSYRNHPTPWRDSISRSKAKVSSVAGGDDTK
jgi:hypothetical protein